MFVRHFHKALPRWKASDRRRPLLLFGPRRVGKTSSVLQFGRNHFTKAPRISFVESPRFKACFETATPEEILTRIEALSGTPLRGKDTLLFLDDLQACPEALAAMPLLTDTFEDLFVVGATRHGTLLFEEPASLDAFHQVHVQPFDFDEFLEAVGASELAGYLAKVSPSHPDVSPGLQEQLLRHLRAYMITGGMPEAIVAYAKGVAPHELEQVQFSILNHLQTDFVAFGDKSWQDCLLKSFRAIPALTGKLCKYNQIDPQVESRKLKRALRQLWLCGCIHPIYHAQPSLPLEDHVHERKFQFLFLDVGLQQRVLRLRSKVLFAKEFSSFEGGLFASQFVGQHLLAGQPLDRLPRLFFWARQARNSRARTDFMVQLDNLILPVMVRSGKRGTLKSVDLFLEQHPHSPLALRFCDNELSLVDRLLSIPFYLAAQWPRLVREALAGSG